MIARKKKAPAKKKVKKTVAPVTPKAEDTPMIKHLRTRTDLSIYTEDDMRWLKFVEKFWDGKVRNRSFVRAVVLARDAEDWHTDPYKVFVDLRICDPYDNEAR